MDMYCHKCKEYLPIIVQISGPHKKAICERCKRYIKFLSKTDMEVIEKEEDNATVTT